MKILFATLFVLVGANPAAADTLPSSAPLYAATLSNLDDKPVGLAQYRGKPLVVNFWARWCAPCRAEIPELARFRDAHKGQIEVIAIGIEDDAAPAREFAQKYGMNYPVFIAKEKGIPLMQALGNTRSLLPYTLFIDRNGVVLDQKAGQLKKEDLDAASGRLLSR